MCWITFSKAHHFCAEHTSNVFCNNVSWNTYTFVTQMKQDTDVPCGGGSSASAGSGDASSCSSFSETPALSPSSPPGGRGTKQRHTNAALCIMTANQFHITWRLFTAFYQRSSRCSVSLRYIPFFFVSESRVDREWKKLVFITGFNWFKLAGRNPQWRKLAKPGKNSNDQNCFLVSNCLKLINVCLDVIGT